MVISRPLVRWALPSLGSDVERTNLLCISLKYIFELEKNKWKEKLEDEGPFPNLLIRAFCCAKVCTFDTYFFQKVLNMHFV